MPAWALLTHHFLLLSSFLWLILLWLTRKGLNHSARLPLGSLTKGQKTLSEHLPENLPPLPRGHIAHSRMLALSIPAANPNPPPSVQRPFQLSILVPIREERSGLSLFFRTLQTPVPRCLAAARGAQPRGAKSTAQDRAPPGPSQSLPGLPQLHTSVPASLPVRCSFPP